MAANSFGSRFVVTTFGESHGPALGVVIDGCPAGIPFDHDLLLEQIKRRRPGQHGAATNAVSSRKEEDLPRILSGIFENKTLGTPIALIIENQDARSEDYDQIRTHPRQGHADDLWKSKFGHSDHRGGGRASGRETAARVMAGAIAQMFLKSAAPQLLVKSYVTQLGHQSFTSPTHWMEQQNEVTQILLNAKKQGESFGAIAELWVEQCPANLGQPVFRKLKSDLAAACMSLGGVTGFEFGDGFLAATQKGTEFHKPQSTQQYGGLRGGLSTGEKITFRVAFKPTSSILDIAKKGRHDPCIALRALPVLEAMTHLTLADHILMATTDQYKN